MDNDYFAVAGMGDRLSLFDKRTNLRQSSNCQRMYDVWLKMEEIRIYDYFPLLVPCYYNLIELTNGVVSGGNATQLYVYKAVLQYSPLKEIESEKISPVCETPFR